MRRWHATALLAAIVASLLASLVMEIDHYLAPQIDSSHYDRLAFLGRYLNERGWAEPILVSWGDPGFWFWSLDRTYLGSQVGQVFNFYGRIQEVYHLAPPLNESSYRILPNNEFVAATWHYSELRDRFGADVSSIRQRPVAYLVPDTYNRPITESFASVREVEPGVWVIPPGSVPDREVNTWTFLAAYDYNWNVGGSESPANWSIAPMILGSTSDALSGTLHVQYRFGTTVRAPYALEFHILDASPEYVPGVPYPPVEFAVDGDLVLSHRYQGLGPIWVGAQTPTLEPGMHSIDVRAGKRGDPLILALDVIRAAPVVGPVQNPDYSQEFAVVGGTSAATLRPDGPPSLPGPGEPVLAHAHRHRAMRGPSAPEAGHAFSRTRHASA